MSVFNKIDDLVDLLNYYTYKYNEGTPKISDKDWDDLYFELEELEKKTNYKRPDSPTQSIPYIVVTNLAKITHKYPILSLAKTKDINEIENFIHKYENVEPMFSVKLDGLSCSLTYINGELVSAETRGDGIEGEDVLHNALVIPSIPKYISYKDELVVNGEIICMKHNFEEFKDQYKNPRNFAAGSIRLLDNAECKNRKLTFVAWDVPKGFEEETTIMAKLSRLINERFYAVHSLIPHYEFDHRTTEDYFNILREQATKFGYPIDGIVVRYNNIAFGESLGRTQHHPNHSMAFKFYDEEYDTELLDIEWTMGRTGVLTPVAIYKDIDIDGTTCSRASLHNVGILKSTLHSKGWKGQNIKIAKMNMIIPQIVWAEEDTDKDKEYLEIPIVCPICGGECSIHTENGIDNLVCDNLNCEGKLINRLDHYCSKKGLDIRGLSKATLSKLIDWGFINSISDIYELKNYKKEWMSKEGFGEKSVSNILDEIEKHKECDFIEFITAIGIPLIGKANAQELAKHFRNYREFRAAIDEHFDFSSIDGFSYAKTQTLFNFNYTEADNLVDKYVTIKEVKNTSVEKDNTLNNLTFVITGKIQYFKNREGFINFIKSKGGKISNNVTASTSYLITNTPNSGTAKNKAAQKYNIPIISEEDFFNKFAFDKNF